MSVWSEGADLADDALHGGFSGFRIAADGEALDAARLAYCDLGNGLAIADPIKTGAAESSEPMFDGTPAGYFSDLKMGGGITRGGVRVPGYEDMFYYPIGARAIPDIGPDSIKIGDVAGFGQSNQSEHVGWGARLSTRVHGLTERFKSSARSLRYSIKSGLEKGG